jgi:hypothetical protein
MSALVIRDSFQSWIIWNLLIRMLFLTNVFCTSYRIVFEGLVLDFRSMPAPIVYSYASTLVLRVFSVFALNKRVARCPKRTLWTSREFIIDLLLTTVGFTQQVLLLIFSRTAKNPTAHLVVSGLFFALAIISDASLYAGVLYFNGLASRRSYEPLLHDSQTRSEIGSELQSLDNGQLAEAFNLQNQGQIEENIQALRHNRSAQLLQRPIVQPESSRTDGDLIISSTTHTLSVPIESSYDSGSILDDSAQTTLPRRGNRVRSSRDYRMCTWLTFAAASKM